MTTKEKVVKLPVSINGYSCPECWRICSSKTLVSKTEPEFSEYPEHHYDWDETHKCKCGILYIIHNGT